MPSRDPRGIDAPSQYEPPSVRDPPGGGAAREWFEAVADATARFSEVRERMVARRVLAGAAGGRDYRKTRHPVGWHADRTARRAEEMIEGEAEDLRELIELRNRIADARRVCEGVSLAIGDRYGNALAARYLARMTGRQAARELGVSERTFYLYLRIAFDYIDSVGVGGAIRGDPV